MGRKVRILEEDAWFLGKDAKQNYPINYRYVISYALLSFLLENDFDKENALEKLKELKGAIDNGETLQGTSFLDVFVLEDNWGLVVVDQLGGVYPLILYSEKRQGAEAEERLTPFAISLEEVIQKFEAVFAYFEGHTVDSWDKEFQEGLFEKAGFTYKE
jgi:hypothetical protein